MKPLSEIDAIKIIDDTLSKIQDLGTKNRILRWAWGKFSTESVPDGIESEEENGKKVKKKKSTKKKNKRLKRKAKRPSIAKDLNLHPKGKQSFEQFFQNKKPKVGDQTYVVCVYYLEKTLSVKEINQNHIYTCMKEVGRKIPKDLENALLVSASRYSNIDTSDLSNITITVPGENLVEHKLKGVE